MTTRFGLIVTDALPLMTLSAADALSCLLIPDVPVLIPDMVHAEVARDMTRLGAKEIVDWIRTHGEQVKIIATEDYAEFEALRAINPNMRSKGRGEQAAAEVLGYEIDANPGLHIILLFEDSDIRNREFVRLLPERVTASSTGDLLHELEAAGRIQSSDRILDEAAAARGRGIEAQRQPARANRRVPRYASS
ncbi:MAG TPA: hypothetical protein VME69_10760 [Methylocella sp.]|nr:hypothetical protein [Methylocella sp.]